MRTVALSPWRYFVTDLIIVGDIAGQYDALMRLLKKCPDYLPVSVGDMVDRGPDSKKVLEFFKEHGKALLGNHEHMMLDYGMRKYYEIGIWESNGGDATLKSFGVSKTKEYIHRRDKRKYIPDDIWEWVASLPYYMEVDDALITHAPIHFSYTLEECIEFTKRPFLEEYRDITGDMSIIWNRYMPKPLEGKYQIFGHNHYHGFLSSADFDCVLDNYEYGVCIDNTGRGELMALVWPTKEIITEPFKRVA